MYYKKLDIDSFEKIQELIVPYMIDYVNQNLTKEKLFYNLIPEEDLQKFKQEIPELFESIRNHLGSEIIFISYLYIDTHSHVPIHTDANNPLVTKRIRLNWPILNSSSASTIFYKKNSENIEGTLSSLSNGVTGHYYDIENCYEVDKYVLDSPTLMNVKELHGIKILNSKLPRILLSMRLSNEDQVCKQYF